MTMLNLTIGDPLLAAHVLAVAAIKYEQDKDAEAVALCKSLAAQIEAQVKVQPVIEEPTETFSVIKARDLMSGTTGLFWTRIRGGWIDDKEGVFRGWLNLEVYEVLRVGIGERQDVAPEDTEDYKAGVSDFAAKLTDRFIYRLQNAISAERKDAFTKAIKDVEELQP